MSRYEHNFIRTHQSMREALEALNQLSTMTVPMTLFVLDEAGRMQGALTDGDIRRALLAGLSLQDPVSAIMNRSFSCIRRHQFSLGRIDAVRRLGIRLLPMLDEEDRVLRVIDFQQKRSVLPVEALIMAGGRGARLKPLTDSTPKPLLKVGEKPIVQYNVERLALYGIERLYFSIRYKGEQLQEYFQDGAAFDLDIRYIEEKEALGTIGALSLIESFEYPYVLVMNSDLLTNIDFEAFFREFIEKDADMIVATIPYEVDIPYAVLETSADRIVAFREKPTYTYHSNAGIYLLKQEHVGLVPHDSFFNATDLIERLIGEGKKVVQFPILGYWLDIGKMEDFKKAQEDIKHIQF